MAAVRPAGPDPMMMTLRASAAASLTLCLLGLTGRSLRPAERSGRHEYCTQAGVADPDPSTVGAEGEVHVDHPHQGDDEEDQDGDTEGAGQEPEHDGPGDLGDGQS